MTKAKTKKLNMLKWICNVSVASDDESKEILQILSDHGYFLRRRIDSITSKITKVSYDVYERKEDE